MADEEFLGMICTKVKKIQETTPDLDKVTYTNTFSKGDKKEGDWVEITIKSNKPFSSQEGEKTDWTKKNCQTSLDSFSYEHDLLSDEEKEDEEEREISSSVSERIHTDSIVGNES
jgi:hypothetical protein